MEKHIIELGMDESAVVLKADGEMTLHLPNIPDELVGTDVDMANAGTILASAIACRLSCDTEWGEELVDWWFNEVDKLEGILDDQVDGETEREG